MINDIKASGAIHSSSAVADDDKVDDTPSINSMVTKLITIIIINQNKITTSDPPKSIK